MKKLEKELTKKKNGKEMDDLEKALKKAIENWKSQKKEETPEVQKERRKVEWKKAFTFLLIASKFIVFASFMYVAMVMYQLDRNAESILIVFAIALYLILNRMEKGG